MDRKAFMQGNQYAVKPEKEKKSVIMTIHCTPEEREQAKIKARDRGTTVSHLVRDYLKSL